MKNYVVWTNCEITEKQGQHGIEAAGNPGVREAYDAMFEASVASARKFLKGEWTALVITETCESRIDMFRKNWRKISDIWHAEECNVLYLDSDTVFVKPVEMFGRFDEYRLFNWTTPPQHEQFEHYFNAAVRYHPATMKEETWAIGEELAKNWRTDIWDQEQIIFNKMFWSQGLSFEDAHHPELNWQAETGLKLPELAQHAQFNTMPLAHARIIHYHGTRSHNRGEYVSQMLNTVTGVTK